MKAIIGEENEEEMMKDLRRGPWTVEEDFALMNYISLHGEGRWNALARSAGLKRTGKSCRLRWLNYLRPDVKRGNITLEEQLLILQLHSRWGNRWSKIAQHLPGRTDNEIKNYWRTRVQKHAKQLKCDINSKQFKDKMQYLWMPRLAEKLMASSPSANKASVSTGSSSISTYNNYANNLEIGSNTCDHHDQVKLMPAPSSDNFSSESCRLKPNNNNNHHFTPENSATASSDSFGLSQVSDLTEFSCNYDNQHKFTEPLISPSGYLNQGGLSFEQNNWMASVEFSDNLWDVEDIWCHQQFN